MTTNDFSPAAGPLVSTVAPAPLRGPVLVASDGSPASEAALTAAGLLAHRIGAEVEVLSVVEPLASPLMAPEAAAPFTHAQEGIEKLRTQQLTAQVRRHAEARGWPLTVELGRPAAVIARVARERGAALIVSAFGQHSILVRMFGTETPLKVARLADTPVLCVPQGFARLPRTVVVAVDFGHECARAAAAARALLADATHVYLVHVRARDRLDMPANVLAEWERVYEAEVNDAFTRVTEALALAPDVGMTTVVLRGAPARELLGFAGSATADLLVAGHGHRGRIDRLIGGSVASQLFRGAQCALLLAPDVTPATEPPLSPDDQTETFEERSRWPADLVRFTERNAARLATLEIDDARLGAQVVARGYPLMGVDYDWRDDSIELSLGDPAHGRGHFTHVVKGPTSLSVRHGADGRARVLRVAREDGQALLSFEEE